MTIYTTQITNKEEGYVMVDVFSTQEKAEAFTNAFCATLSDDDMKCFNRKWSIQTNFLQLDKPDYPFLNNK